ncbi:Nce102 protein [Saccharomycopsis crataegensis]|uniref:Nce102 protein n=1 Tax=Saccharomycopsis crataegensis TaxID=43959 RepID=A0AAV5QSW9_9ASCO|nr:Nce102 protein [Saccharomycopsis crataegensis]
MALPIADIILRGFNTAFLIIVLGLTGSLIEGQQSSHARVNMALFASVFGIVFSSFYAVLAAFVSVFAWPILLFIADFLNFVFTFSAATALAVGIRCHSCTNQSYLNSNAIIEGSEDRCRKSQASVAFLYFSFFIFLVNLVMSTFTLVNGGAFGFGVTGRGSTKGGLPSVSQV